MVGLFNLNHEAIGSAKRIFKLVHDSVMAIIGLKLYVSKATRKRALDFIDHHTPIITIKATMIKSLVTFCVM